VFEGMKFLFLGVFVATALSATVDICLPEPVHSYVEVFNEHHDDRSEHGAITVAHDTTAKMIKFMYTEGHRHPHHEVELLDFNKMYAYHWEVHNETARHCTVQRMQQPMAPVCVSHKANKTHDGTIGEDYKVEFYHAQLP
jgi:hypothetical protein